jgi:fumarate reductase flavoprotein subunit
MTAALRAAELGLRVAVLEQEAEPHYPCNSRYSGGILHVSYQDPKLSPAELERAVAAAVGEAADPVLVAAVATDAGRAVDWLCEHGARFIRGPIPWQRWVLAPPRPLTPGPSWSGRGSDLLLRALGQRLEHAGGRIFLGTRASDLRLVGQSCVGVVASSGEQSVEFGGAVVIADGGFQADADMFRRHIGPRPDRVVQRGAGNSRGDGLRLARRAGAALTAMDRFYGHVLSANALTSVRLSPYPTLDAVATVGVVVDRTGNRCLDEGLGGIFIANHLATLADPASATIIIDTKIWNEVGQGVPYLPNTYLEQAGGTVYRADTLDALALRAGLPGDALRRTVAAHNAALERRDFGRLSLPRSIKTAPPRPIAVPPFLAVPICPGITNTMGGIAIDSNARVRRPDGGVIAGLYAAGAAIGGLEGGAEVGYVGGLIKAVVFGLRAGEHAARNRMPELNR